MNDSNASLYTSPEYRPIQPPTQPVYPVAEIAQQTVDVQRYEPYSIAGALHTMFEEADQAGSDERYYESAFSREEYPSDTEAFRMYLQEVHRELKTSSAVQELRQAAEAGREITTDMVQNVFRAYERIVSTAADRLRRTLSPEQLTQLKKSSRQNLDWSYRGLLLERLTQEPDAPTRYSIEDVFLILNPKARKVQYMERQEILKTLRNSMALGNKEQLQNDVRLARQFAHEDMAGETVTDSDLRSFEQDELTNTTKE